MFFILFSLIDARPRVLPDLLDRALNKVSDCFLTHSILIHRSRMRHVTLLEAIDIELGDRLTDPKCQHAMLMAFGRRNWYVADEPVIAGEDASARMARCIAATLRREMRKLPDYRKIDDRREGRVSEIRTVRAGLGLPTTKPKLAAVEPVLAA